MQVSLAMTLAACCGLIDALKQTFDTKAFWTALTVAFVISPMEGSSLRQGLLRMMGSADPLGCMAYVLAWLQVQ